MNADLLLFLTLAAVAVITGIAMLISRSTVYSAMHLVMNFITIALFYMLLGGPFIAMSQVTVYAGAIMVLFLFVIMLLGVNTNPNPQRIPYQRPLAIGMAVILGLEAVYILFVRPSSLSMDAAPLYAADFGSPISLAQVLFSQYALPMQIVAIILLVAMVGVIVMTKNARQATGAGDQAGKSAR